MDGSMMSAETLPGRDMVRHSGGPDVHGHADAGTFGPAAPNANVTFLMRDGSRMAVMLADPMRQAPELAAALAPLARRPETITVELDDASRLILSASEVIGLLLPPEPAIVPAPLARMAVPARAAAPAVSHVDNVEVHTMGAQRVMRIRDFLPESVVADLYRYVLAKQPEFKPSTVLSNDPEYRKSVVLYKFPEYEAMFRDMLRAALPQICASVGVPVFDFNHFECQLTATSDKGYFKPHTDNAAALAHRKLTYVYYFHRQPKPFTGGEIRLFDHNPFAVEQGTARNLLELAPLNNSIIFFDSSCYHEVRDTICVQPTFENSRFTINGWLGLPKPA